MAGAQAWIDASFSPQVRLGDLSYGLQWWMPSGDAPSWAAGFGNGGQRLSINRAMGLALIVFAGRYNDPDAWRLPVAIDADFLGPALAQAQRGATR